MVHVDIPETEISSEVLRQAIAGEVDSMPASVALSLLLEGDISEVDPAALLRDSVRNQDLARHARIGAVPVYSLVAGEESVPVLVDALDDAETGVASAAATALGNVGTPDQLDVLRRAQERGGLTSARAAFAEALIVHRFELADQPVELAQVDVQDPPSVAGALTFASVRPGLLRRDLAVKAINRYLPWFGARVSDVYEIQCGDRLLEVAVAAHQLTERPTVPAVIAVQDPEYGEFYPRLIALSSPAAGGRAAMRVTRLTGEAVYVGEAVVSGDRAELELRGAAVPGVAAVDVRVHLTARSVEISGISSRRVATKRTPQRAPE